MGRFVSLQVENRNWLEETEVVTRSNANPISFTACNCFRSRRQNVPNDKPFEQACAIVALAEASHNLIRNFMHAILHTWDVYFVQYCDGMGSVTDSSGYLPLRSCHLVSMKEASSYS